MRHPTILNFLPNQIKSTFESYQIVIEKEKQTEYKKTSFYINLKAT